LRENNETRLIALLLFNSRLPKEANVARPKNQIVENMDAPAPKANLSTKLLNFEEYPPIKTTVSKYAMY